VRGYPFRLEVFCTALDVARPAEGLTVKAGAFRSAAQVYEPRRVYAELDSPVAVTSAICRRHAFRLVAGPGDGDGCAAASGTRSPSPWRI
jgi:hypothetical protein